MVTAWWFPRVASLAPSACQLTDRMAVATGSEAYIAILAMTVLQQPRISNFARKKIAMGRALLTYWRVHISLYIAFNV